MGRNEKVVQLDDVSDSDLADTHIDRQKLHSFLPPHDSYEGKHRFDPQSEWTAAEERRVVRKTDLILLPWLCLMFATLQLDRGNMANALAGSVLKDLHMTTEDYNLGTTIQTVTLIVAEFPVQLIAKRYGFKRVLPTLMCSWSLVSIFQAFMQDRTSYFITRALLGIFEGGFIPGVVLLATYFYTSAELSFRLSIFWAMVNLTRVISAFLAAPILEMQGVGGRPGWFWLLVLEGILTLIIAILSYFYVPSGPTGTKSILFRHSWYTEREETIMVNRILRDDPAKGLTGIHEPAKLHDIKAALTDKALWGLYFLGLVAFIPMEPMMRYITFLIKKAEGFSTMESNLLSAPAPIIGVFTGLAIAFSSDYFKERTFHCLIGEIWCFPLFIALLTLPNGANHWSRYSLTTLLAGFPFCHPILNAWISENSFDVKKRAIATATYNVCVQIGTVVGTQIYQPWDAPYFKVGNTICVSILGLAIVTFVAQRQFLVYLNQSKRQQWDTMTVEEKTAYQSDTLAREIDGNRRLDFLFAI